MKRKVYEKSLRSFMSDFSSGKIKIPENVKEDALNSVIGNSTLLDSLIDKWFDSHKPVMKGDRISTNPNRRSRRSLWASIPRKDRQPWETDCKRYHELRPKNIPFHLEWVAL